MSKVLLLTFAICFLLAGVFAQSIEKSGGFELPLKSGERLTLINLNAKSVEFKSREGIRITKADNYTEGETIAIVNGIEFNDGTIEVELAGEPAPDADPQMRGFIGIAFRLQETEPFSYECFYLRPTNGRADNQLQRNHSTQYVSHPEFPWYRMRKESPGVYESYVDLQPGEWTKVKIEVSGNQAKLYVHDAEQPCLIVKDLKHKNLKGKIALWLHSSTVAHFRNLVVTPKEG
jgi:hypothetical protein